MNAMIQVRNLVKWYGPTLAVDGVSFEIDRGRIVGFLGPNGAGKSTTLRILTGFIPPTDGSATVAGHDVIRDSAQARAMIGYLPEHTPLYPELRVEEYLHYRGRLMNMPRKARLQRIAYVCDRCGLAQARRRIIGRLSRGNRQRVGLAQALLHEPPVLILDEPTAGLDATQLSHVRDLIAELRDEHSVLLSTHILPEVERLADHVLIIARGRIVAAGEPSALVRQVASDHRLRIELRADAQRVRAAIGALATVEQVEMTQQGELCVAVVRPRGDLDVRDAVAAVIAEHRWPVREMRHEAASLEAFFVRITAEQQQGAASA